MKKIPTCFVRDWDGDRSRVLPEVTPGCEWVFEGEGEATQKLDGMAALVVSGSLFRRHEVKPNRKTGEMPSELPVGFTAVETDETTGAIVGWLPVGEGPEDRWFREAFARLQEEDALLQENGLPVSGTYELLGPKVQANPEHEDEHVLVRHADATRFIVARTFEGMRDLLDELDVEGFVFHHPDGRMAKIKARDFGIRRVEKTADVAA